MKPDTTSIENASACAAVRRCRGRAARTADRPATRGWCRSARACPANRPRCTAGPVTISAVLLAIADVGVGAIAIAGIVVLGDLAQAHPAAVVHHHVPHAPRVVVGGNRRCRRNEIGLHDLHVVLARIGVALGRAFVIVERHARRDHVDEREAAVRQAGLQDRHELRLVAGEAARDERGAKRQRQQAAVDRLHRVGLALLAERAAVGRRRELPFRQAVDAVVLEHVEQVHVAPDRVRELAEPDRQRVAVARYADVDQLAVGRVGSGHERRHASMDAVEAVRLFQEVRGRLRRTADAGELGDAMRRNRQLPERLHDGRGDRVVPASGAQRRHRPFVVAARETDLVALETGVNDRRVWSMYVMPLYPVWP